MSSLTAALSRGNAGSSDNLRQVGFVGDDASLARALCEGHPGAPAALFDRYGSHVQRVLFSVLGFDLEIQDLLHDVFAEAFRGIKRLEDGERLRAWLSSIAVFTARGCIRARSRRRFFGLALGQHVEHQASAHHGATSIEDREALTQTYGVLEQLSADLRIPFSLRYIEGLRLVEIAECCGVSLATTKRRLVRAEKRFVKLAQREPALEKWLEEGTRWKRS